MCDDPEELRRKVRELAGAVRNAKYLVVYTGAGISTVGRRGEAWAAGSRVREQLGPLGRGGPRAPPFGRLTHGSSPGSPKIPLNSSSEIEKVQMTPFE